MSKSAKKRSWRFLAMANKLNQNEGETAINSNPTRQQLGLS